MDLDWQKSTNEVWPEVGRWKSAGVAVDQGQVGVGVGEVEQGQVGMGRRVGGGEVIQ